MPPGRLSWFFSFQGTSFNLDASVLDGLIDHLLTRKLFSLKRLTVIGAGIGVLTIRLVEAMKYKGVG